MEGGKSKFLLLTVILSQAKQKVCQVVGIQTLTLLGHMWGFFRRPGKDRSFWCWVLWQVKDFANFFQTRPPNSPLMRPTPSLSQPASFWGILLPCLWVRQTTGSGRISLITLVFCLRSFQGWGRRWGQDVWSLLIFPLKVVPSSHFLQLSILVADPPAPHPVTQVECRPPTSPPSLRWKDSTLHYQPQGLPLLSKGRNRRKGRLKSLYRLLGLESLGTGAWGGGRVQKEEGETVCVKSWEIEW